MRHSPLVPATLILLAGAVAPALAQFPQPTVFHGAPAAPWIDSRSVPVTSRSIVLPDVTPRSKSDSRVSRM